MSECNQNVNKSAKNDVKFGIACLLKKECKQMIEKLTVLAEFSRLIPSQRLDFVMQVCW